MLVVIFSIDLKRAMYFFSRAIFNTFLVHFSSNITRNDSEKASEEKEKEREGKFIQQPVKQTGSESV